MSMTDMPKAGTDKNRRIVALVIAVCAVAALGYAAVSKQWLYNPRTIDPDYGMGRIEFMGWHTDMSRFLIDGWEVGFGPRGTTLCARPGRCDSLTNAELVDDFAARIKEAEVNAKQHPEDEGSGKFAGRARDKFHASGAFPIFGWIAFIGVALAAVSLLASAALVAAKKQLVLPVMPTTTALLGLIVGLFSGCIFVALKPGPAGFVGVSWGFYAFGAGVIAGIASCLMLNKLMRPADPDLLEDAMNPDEFPS